MINMLKEFRKLFGPWVTAAPPKRKPRRILLRLEDLEGRIVPASTTWSPQGGSTDGTDKANYTNGLPNQTNELVLDGSVSKANILFKANLPTSIASIQVINGYQGTLTFSGGTLTTLKENDGSGNCTLTISAADNSGGVILSNNNDFVVKSGGNLKLVDSGAAAGGTFLSAQDTGNGTVGDYLNNQGTVTWTGTAVASGKNAKAIIDTMGVPVLNNTGTFKVDGGTKGNTTMVGGILFVTGQDPTNTNDVSFYNKGGALAFSNDAELDALDNFYQSAGSITSDDTGKGETGGQECALVTGQLDGKGGDINIAGGSVTVDSASASLGTLKFLSAAVEFNGVLDVSGLKTGGNSTQADLLDCSGDAVTLGTNSYLNVGTKGSQGLGTGNRWTVMMYASISGEWTTEAYPGGMIVSTGPTNVLVSN
jgi:hypothetical protein